VYIAGIQSTIQNVLEISNRGGFVVENSKTGKEFNNL
jgi:hypothetical protein